MVPVHHPLSKAFSSRQYVTLGHNPKPVTVLRPVSYKANPCMLIYIRKLTFQPKAQKQDIPQHATNYRWLTKSEFKSFGLQHKKLPPKQLLGWRFPFFYVSLKSSALQNMRTLRKFSPVIFDVFCLNRANTASTDYLANNLKQNLLLQMRYQQKPRVFR